MVINIQSLVPIIAIAVVVLILLILIIRRVKRRGGSSVSTNNAQVYIGNLPYRVNEGDLKEYFSAYGRIVDVRMVKDRKTGRSKGYAFITYSNASEADESLDSHGDDMHGRSIVVRIAKPR